MTAHVYWRALFPTWEVNASFHNRSVPIDVPGSVTSQIMRSAGQCPVDRGGSGIPRRVLPSASGLIHLSRSNPVRRQLTSSPRLTATSHSSSITPASCQLSVRSVSVEPEAHYSLVILIPLCYPIPGCGRPPQQTKAAFEPLHVPLSL